MTNNIKNACASWGEQVLDEEERVYECGDVSLTVQSVHNEIWIKHVRGNCEENAKWRRWSVNSELTHFNLSPLLPDKSVVVKPEYPFTLVKGATAKIYVRIPIVLKLDFGKGKEKFSYELPSVVLSNTWFGDFLKGERCYWLSSSARRKPLLETERRHYAVCPVTITNKSDEELLIEKLRLHVAHLALYLEHDFLWACETKISYRGGGIISAVDFASSAPAELKSFSASFKAREANRKKGIGYTFDTILDIASFGLL